MNLKFKNIYTFNRSSENLEIFLVNQFLLYEYIRLIHELFIRSNKILLYNKNIDTDELIPAEDMSPCSKRETTR